MSDRAARITLKTIITTFIFSIAVLAGGYAMYTMSLNSELEDDLREERLKAERLLSEKLEIEKELENMKKALNDAEVQLKEFKDHKTDNTLSAVKIELKTKK